MSYNVKLQIRVETKCLCKVLVFFSSEAFRDHITSIILLFSCWTVEINNKLNMKLARVIVL